MKGHIPAAPSQDTSSLPGWSVSDPAPTRAAPEILRCQAFTTEVPFDRTALSIAAGVDEAWALEGSDPALQMLILEEQTVLQGPHCDVLAGARSVQVDDVAAETQRWPLLADTRALPDAPYTCLLVVPLGGALSTPPVGTFCLARDAHLPFGAHEVEQAVAFSVILTELLLNRWRSVRDVDLFEGLVHDERHLAAGILASLLGLPPQEALAAMRARAFTEGRTLADFSSEIVAMLGAERSS